MSLKCFRAETSTPLRAELWERNYFHVAHAEALVKMLNVFRCLNFLVSESCCSGGEVRKVNVVDLSRDKHKTRSERSSWSVAVSLG